MKRYFYITFQYINNNNTGYYELDFISDAETPFNLAVIKKKAIDQIFKLRSYKLLPRQIIINYIHEFASEADFNSFFQKPDPK
ncbi:MAG: hypothetical protein BGO09_00595 [Bacteroidetes bacterium 47-18]|nr:MAG: hypothetical protein BGO09_00595 [Bacteroidetes bacterium 47-18]